MTNHRLNLARDLSSIRRMIPTLHDRAVDLANHPDIPGGDATINLGPIADHDQWEQRNLAARDELAPYADPDSIWPPVQLIHFWAQHWRTKRGHNYPGDRPSLTRQLTYLQETIDWCLTQPHANLYAVDIRRARHRLENILRDGHRPDRIWARCPHCFDHWLNQKHADKTPTRKPSRLITHYGKTPDKDRWICPTCRHKYDHTDVYAAKRRQLIWTKNDDTTPAPHA